MQEVTKLSSKETQREQAEKAFQSDKARYPDTPKRGNLSRTLLRSQGERKHLADSEGFQIFAGHKKEVDERALVF